MPQEVPSKKRVIKKPKTVRISTAVVQELEVHLHELQKNVTAGFESRALINLDGIETLLRVILRQTEEGTA